MMRIGDAGHCSATKIAARRFLTAAHCIADTATGTVADTFAAGRTIQLSNAIVPVSSDLVNLPVIRAELHPDFEQALERFHTYKVKAIDEYRIRYSGIDLEKRIHKIESDNHFTQRHPDLAVVTVRELTPSIPTAGVDFAPLVAGEQVDLVGYGCETGLHGPSASPGRRWGKTWVIRVDAVNFYTFAHQMRPGAPSLCPGDSGGPVMREGKVVGVLGTVYGLSEKLGARSNMSVNLQGYRAWTPLH
jgi:hypothetical protein